MTADELKSSQAPLKAQYRERPETALVTLKAEGRVGENMTCKIETGKARVEAGLHPATGGDGRARVPPTCCSKRWSDAQALHCSAVATALGISLRDATIRAEGDLDFRGTLGVSKDVPVGFKQIRLNFDLDTDATRRADRDTASSDRTLLRCLSDAQSPSEDRGFTPRYLAPTALCH